MKRFLLVSVIFLLMDFASRAQNNVGINDDNSAAKASAMLDVYSTTKGMLIPRIALTVSTTAAPVTSPEASLLVYNTATAGDVTPGYYYWNGTSKWVRLTAGTDPARNFSMVSKSANATLLKTENVVLASGNITLTLPVVTSTDDGLEITIKNVGTYTDLITVVPESGKTIDAVSNSLLTRWRGRTYLARGSNWIIKDEETHTDNHYDVSATGSFTTIAEVVAFLNVHMTGPSVVRLGGGIYPVTSTVTINRPFPLTFQGLSYGETEITCPSGSAAFDAQTECYFKELMFTGDVTPGIGIQFSGALKYYEIKDCSFFGFTRAINITSSSELWLFETDFENCTASGVEIAAGSGNVSFKTSECDFINCAKGINMATYGTGAEFSILNCTFYNSTGQTGIFFVPGSAPYFSSMIIQANSFNNIGSFASGFDFTRSDGRDSKAFIENNAGVPSEHPHCKINLANNTATTSPATAGSWYRVNNFSGGASFVYNSYATKWTIASNSNRITYQPTNVRDGIGFISGSFSATWSGGAASRNFNIAIVKNTSSSPQVNPTRFGETTLRVIATGQTVQFSTNIYLANIGYNDYFEIWVSSVNGGETVTIDDLNWWTDTH
jgi:hypothetical protein